MSQADGTASQRTHPRLPKSFRLFRGARFHRCALSSQAPIAKAFANASWQQQERAIENIITLRKHGWKGVNMQLHLDAVSQVEKVAMNCLKKGDWVLDRIEEELAFMRGADFRR